MAYDKRKMQDITYSEYKRGLFDQYKTMWTNADFDGINKLLSNNPELKYKIFDAFNWNRLINLINDQTTADLWDKTKTYKMYEIVSYGDYTWMSKEDLNMGVVPQVSSNLWYRLLPLNETSSATYNSLVGKWQIDYSLLKNIVDNFKYVGEWNTNQNFKLGNLVNIDKYHSYFCLQEHTSATGNRPPNSTYWAPAQTMLDSVGLKVLENPPTNYSVGDIYLQVIN